MLNYRKTINSYGGVVYDVTNFVANHPGGSEKILLAAGSVRFLSFVHEQIYDVVVFTKYFPWFQ